MLTIWQGKKEEVYIFQSRNICWSLWPAVINHKNFIRLCVLAFQINVPLYSSVACKMIQTPYFITIWSHSNTAASDFCTWELLIRERLPKIPSQGTKGRKTTLESYILS